jgi:hypothetical protein
MLRESLAAKFFGYAERFDRTEAIDALTPVGVFGLTYRAPVSGNEIANPPSDHESIVTRGLGGPQHSVICRLIL